MRLSGRALGWAVVVLGVASCHSTIGRERRPSVEAEAGATGLEPVGGEPSSTAATGGSEADVTNGLGGAAPGGWGPTGDAATAGNRDDSVGPGGGGVGPESTCEPDVVCTPALPCWKGKTECVDGKPLCEPIDLAAAKTPCREGYECTGDGSCIKAVTSCAQEGTPGCGAVTIPGGSFKMGWRAAEPEAFQGRSVTVGTFVIDAYEVSVARFRAFWTAGHPAASVVTYPSGDVLSSDDPQEPERTKDNDAYNWSTAPAGREAFPINRIYWDTALAFCAWDGGRLPTEAEWEYAATGRDVDDLVSGRTYPWGETTPTCELAHGIECEPAKAVPVDALPAYAGVYQMAGNVLEWTADGYEEYGATCWASTDLVNPLCLGNGTHTVRGGSFVASLFTQTPGTWRTGLVGTSAGRGMRCVRNVTLN